MNFTLTTLAVSLAAHLAPALPGIQLLEDPAQQGVEPPCLFLQQRGGSISGCTGGRWLRTIRLDLTCLLEYSLPDQQRQYNRVAEVLDYEMETFPYTDEAGQTTLLRTYDRSTDIDDEGLHYKFELRVFVEKPVDTVKMQTQNIWQKEKVDP